MENRTELDLLKEELSAIRGELKAVNKGIQSMHYWVLLAGVFVLITALRTTDSPVVIICTIIVMLGFIAALFASLVKTLTRKKNKS